MKLSFIIPTMSNVKDLRICVASLRSFHPKEIVIIISNGATPEQLKNQKEIATRFKCEFFAFEKPLGFAVPVNAGIKLANQTFDPDAYILINDDIVFIRPVVENIVEGFGFDKKIGIFKIFML